MKESALRGWVSGPIVSLLVASTPALAQGELTLVDTEVAGPGPGDNMVIVERGRASFVVSLAFDGDQAVTHRLERNATLTFVGRTPTGDGPRAVALARRGDFAVVANSHSHDLSVMDVGEDGLLREVSRVSSQGLNPFDVAVAHDDLVLVANRDSDELAVFHLDRRGNLRLLGKEATGAAPHVVAISPRGLVAVGNSGSSDLSLFEVSRRGELFPVNTTFALGAPPIAVSFGTFGRSLFVAARSAQPLVVEDRILAYRVDRRGELAAAGSYPGGLFLTDLDVTPRGLFAVTVNSSGQDELRSYRRRWTDLTLDATLATPGSPPPSFKQVASAPARGRVDRHVFVTEYQAGWLRSITYER